MCAPAEVALMTTKVTIFVSKFIQLDYILFRNTSCTGVQTAINLGIGHLILETDGLMLKQDLLSEMHSSPVSRILLALSVFMCSETVIRQHMC